MSHLGPFQVYVADGEGSIHLLRKNAAFSNKSSSDSLLVLIKHAKWESVHRLGISFIDIVRDENLIGETMFFSSIVLFHSFYCSLLLFIYSIPSIVFYSFY